jgi:hypothetical protein
MGLHRASGRGNDGRPLRGELYLDQMRCTQCAAVSYSAAARLLVERGERCPLCGGAMALVPDDAPVAVAAEAKEIGSEEQNEEARRFKR